MKSLFLAALISSPTLSVELIRVSEMPTYDQGKRQFRINCASCHGLVGQGGPICPPNAGSSLELLKFKVLQGKYPPGYKSKRNTHIMPRFPGLEKYLPDIELYLRNPSK